MLYVNDKRIFRSNNFLNIYYCKIIHHGMYAKLREVREGATRGKQTITKILNGLNKFFK